MDKTIEKQRLTRPERIREALGRPGEKPHWTSGAKTLVGTAIPAASRIWFTISSGVLDEIYFPDVDKANTASVRFLVTGASDSPDHFFSDERFDANHTVEWLAPGVPGAIIHSACKRGRYTLEKHIITDPVRDTLLMWVRFTPTGNAPLRLFYYLNAQVADQGAGNDAWVGDYKGETLLFASRAGLSIASMLTVPMLTPSVGFKGASDGLHTLSQGKPLPSTNLASRGNVALTAEVDYRASALHDGSFVVSLAGGSDPAESAQQARAGVRQRFEKTRDLFLQQWNEQQALYADVADLSGSPLNMYRVSTAVLETHQSKRFPGGFIASLSLPWGFDRSDQDMAGYHVVWPRDLVETAMGKLASGDARAARSALFYMRCVQDGDGGWAQNMWLDGTPHWTAIQMDGIALPVLLADHLRREDALDGYNPVPMVDETIRFILRHGPVTQQDRWETTPGYSTWTMAIEIAALLAGAACAELSGNHAAADFLRSTADAWNDAVDELLYVTDTPLAQKHGVPGYYMRMAPPERIEHPSIGQLTIRMPNHCKGNKTPCAIDIVSPDVLALVRFGVRHPHDPRIVSTIKIIDETLRRETATGLTWTRATDDGYGEHADGAPFGTHGIGRGWPLLVGERAHYEIAAGNHDFALELCRTIARQTSECGMIPEQVWDAPDIPSRFLFNGHPAGSGMPLVWAHAEYIKLLRSLHANAVWDRPPDTYARYVEQQHPAPFQIWTPKQRRRFLTAGKQLRLDLPFAASVHCDALSLSASTTDSGYGLHCLTLETAHLTPGSTLSFTITPHKDQPAVDGVTIPQHPDSATVTVHQPSTAP